jgi:hypothetical protein
MSEKVVQLRERLSESEKIGPHFSDVTPELALQTISSLTVLGALQASPAIKAALAARIEYAARAAGKAQDHEQ